MNSIQNNGPDDKLLKDELEELGQAYQQLESEEPPELLDQAILNSAHRAVEGSDHWMDFGWIHGLTTAAVVVLALSIILTQRQPVGLEESGLTPVDPASLGRSRSDEQQANGALQTQGEARLEPMKESSKDMIQVMPAAEAPEAQTASQATPAAARAVQSEFRAKKRNQSEPAVLEEDIMQINEPAKPALQGQVVNTLADEQIDALKTDADKAREHKVEAEQSQMTTEETQLQLILALKHAGDDRWEIELKKFTEAYPDYALPDELLN